MPRCLAIIPARGGSVGLPFKNILTVGGVPLVKLAVDIACAVPEINDHVVSTNRERIAGAAGTWKIVKRPEELSTGFVGDVRVLTHALLRYEEINHLEPFDEIVMLQPTSPLRTVEDVSRAIQMRREGNWDSVWTVSRTPLKYHPMKQLVLDEGGASYWSVCGSEVLTRQELMPTHTRNGVAYVLTRACLLEQKMLMGYHSTALVLDAPQISIDDANDLQRANEQYERNQKEHPEA